MNCTECTKQISLIGSLNEEWIKLPVVVMKEVGPAAQTLGGLLKMTSSETFAKVEKIAASARLPVATVRKHLVCLHENGWIQNVGRIKSTTGRCRRTCTIQITQQAHDRAKEYTVLPVWACGRLNWSARAVLSVVMRQLLKLKAAAKRDGSQDEGDIIAFIEKAGSDARFRFSLDDLTGLTGLTRYSVVGAKRDLHRRRIIVWSRGDSEREPHKLVPNWEFFVTAG